MRRSEPGSSPAPSSETDLRILCSWGGPPWTFWRAPGITGEAFPGCLPRSPAPPTAAGRSSPCLAPRLHPGPPRSTLPLSSSLQRPWVSPSSLWIKRHLLPYLVLQFFSGQNAHHARIWAESGWKSTGERSLRCPQQCLELGAQWCPADGRWPGPLFPSSPASSCPSA